MKLDLAQCTAIHNVFMVLIFAIRSHFGRFSSGRSSLMSMELTPLEHTLVNLTSNSRGSMSTTMRPAAASTCPGPSWWTWSPAPWTAWGPVPLDRSSDLITLCLDSLELVTTGPRGTTQKVKISKNKSPIDTITSHITDISSEFIVCTYFCQADHGENDQHWKIISCCYIYKYFLSQLKWVCTLN